MTTLVTNTLPTIVGMGVVSRAIDTTFARRQAAAARRRGTTLAKKHMKRPHATVLVGTSRTKSGAEDFAAKCRRTLKRQGKPYVGRVKVKKVSGGYVAVFMRG